MPVCTKCPHAADVQAGKYADAQFSKVPCFACRFTGDIPSHKGKVIVSLDSQDGAANEIAQADLVDRDTPLQELPAGLLAFFRTWLALPGPTRDAFAWRMLNPTRPLSVLAKERKITAQAIQQAVKRAETELCRHLGTRFLTPHAPTYGRER